MNDRTPPNRDAVLARLDAERGPQYWRSLEELADTEEFRSLLDREFPQGAAEMTDPVGRRQFLRLMGASLALAGVTACTRQPPEKIVPYVNQPEGLVPGRPTFFATAVSLGGFATGVLVESHEGRPTKIEGNPDHPASLGATDARTQASVLDLYDPDRAQTITCLGDIRPWSDFLSAVRTAVEGKRASGGTGLRILTETVTSPTLAFQIRALLAELPGARWHQWEPIGRDQAKAGALAAFGERVDAVFAVDKAKVILSLDSDLLAAGPGALRYARQFARHRTVGGDCWEMNRLYVVESTVSLTGQAADHRLPLPASKVHGFTLALAGALGIPGVDPELVHLDPSVEVWAKAVAEDLRSNEGASLVVVGDEQPAAVHALAHVINGKLGNIGQTVTLIDPVEAEPIDQSASLHQLVADMISGQVDMLVIVGGNPVHTAPADLNFARALDKVAIRIHLSQHHDETSALCHWHVPEAHALESWSDARAFDGTASIVQPLIAPLAGGKTAHELLAAFGKQAGQPGYDLVRGYWRSRFERDQPAGDFELFWRKSLHDGFVPQTACAPRTVTLRPQAFGPPPAAPVRAGALEVNFRADPSVYDGRFANNGWLQELPRPHTKLVWDNAVLLNPATAERLGVVNGDQVELDYGGRTLRGGVWLLPGLPRETALLHLGYGRKRAGRVGTGVGFSAYAIRVSKSAWFDGGLTVKRTGGGEPLVSTQLEQVMHGRHIVRSAALEEFRRNPLIVHEGAETPPKALTFYPEHKYEGYAWGMAIDVNLCIGCNACVLACQSENNIPVVGRQQVEKGHRMHWLRVDRYYEGDLDNPRSFNQPVPCMHCEMAPCEVVCPVAATSHSSEGLNDMAYNRCVGTRYCSNNCPYKVRRFNFLLYQDWTTPTLKAQRNPDVTVRSRGVMEKCTYCVQRINKAKIEAEKEGRPVRDGEIVTACEAVCPTQAIVFGNVNDPASRVARLKADARNYGLLDELNTRPRTTHLAALRNPNPEMPAWASPTPDAGR